MRPEHPSESRIILFVQAEAVHVRVKEWANSMLVLTDVFVQIAGPDESPLFPVTFWLVHPVRARSGIVTGHVNAQSKLPSAQFLRDLLHAFLVAKSSLIHIGSEHHPPPP